MQEQQNKSNQQSSYGYSHDHDHGNISKGSGMDWSFLAGNKVRRAFIGVVLAGLGLMVLSAGKDIYNVAISNTQQIQQTQSVVIGEKEYEELGLQKGATHADIWQEVRSQPIQQLNLCATGATTLVTHGLAGNDVASVNGVTVTAAQNGIGLLRIPAGVNKVQITGVSSTDGDRVLFVLDAWTNDELASITPERNGCNLSEFHGAVAVRVGETITIPVTHSF